MNLLQWKRLKNGKENVAKFHANKRRDDNLLSQIFQNFLTSSIITLKNSIIFCFFTSYIFRLKTLVVFLVSKSCLTPAWTCNFTLMNMFNTMKNKRRHGLKTVRERERKKESCMTCDSCFLMTVSYIHSGHNLNTAACQRKYDVQVNVRTFSFLSLSLSYTTFVFFASSFFTDHEFFSAENFHPSTSFSKIFLRMLSGCVRS